MNTDLADDQWEAVGRGELTAPDGVRYVRRTTRAKRRDCDVLISEGTSLVLFYWAGGQLDWLDGTDADKGWREVRAAVTSNLQPPKGDLQWTAGIWESYESQQIVLLTGTC